MKLHPLFVALFIAGCSGFPKANLSGEQSVIIKPKYGAGTLAIQGAVNVYSSNDINHLTVQLLKMPSQTQIASLDIPKSNLNNTLSFSHLMANQDYRIMFTAYKAVGTASADIISHPGPWVDFTTETDDRPSIVSLNVRLIDKAFNAIATSSFDIKNGGYNYVASESLDVWYPTVTTFAGTNASGSVSGTLAQARFYSPSKLVVRANGEMFVTDTGNNRVQRISGSDVYNIDFFLLAPYGIADAQTEAKLYITTDNSLAYIFPTNYSGGFSRGLSPTCRDLAQVSDNDGCGFDPIVSLQGSSLFAMDLSGGGEDYPEGMGLNNPRGLETSGDILYIADTGNNQILKCSNLSGWVHNLVGSGDVLTVLQRYGSGAAGYADGNATTAQFNAPRDIALDAQGNLYVSDTGNHRIRKIDPSGGVTTYAGPSGAPEAGYANGSGPNARFNSPDGLDFDSNGNLYVVDTGNHCIRKISWVL